MGRKRFLKVSITMHKLLSPFRQSKLLNTIFLSNIFISFHYALVIYINSSYLNNFFSETQVSTLYIIGSIANTIFLLNASKLLERIGSYRFMVYTIIIEFVATLGLVVSSSPFLIASYFLIHLITISLLLFNMDVFVESLSKDAETGGIRATYLTLTNITIVMTPLLIAALLTGNNFSYVYLLSALFLVPLYQFVKRFKKIKTSTIKPMVKNSFSPCFRSSISPTGSSKRMNGRSMIVNIMPTSDHEKPICFVKYIGV